MAWHGLSCGVAPLWVSEFGWLETGGDLGLGRDLGGWEELCSMGASSGEGTWEWGRGKRQGSSWAA